MRVTILGSGTSSGVPMIGCDCAVCTSPNPKNRRLRSSVAIELGPKRLLLIDTAPDLRAQALSVQLPRVDAVLYTHAHADHIHGIDELRTFNIRHLHEIPCYGNADTIRRLRAYFDYIFDHRQHESLRPFLTLHEVFAPFVLLGVEVVPVPLLHGKLEVLGYRIGDFAYLTDVSEIPSSSWSLLRGLDVMVIDALRHRPHATHFSIDQAVAAAERAQPIRCILTHLSHQVDHETVNKTLPIGVELAYDGLVLDLADPSLPSESAT